MTRVIIGTSNWRDYAFCAPLAALLWREVVGHEPYLLLVGTEEDWQKPKRNLAVLEMVRRLKIDHRLIPAADGYETHVTAQNCRQHAAALPFANDDWLMLSDADLFPMKRDFYHQHGGASHRFVLYYANGDHYQSYPTCHMMARASEWRKLYGLKPSGDLTGQMERNLDNYLKPKVQGLAPSEVGWISWMNDQWMFTEWIKKQPWYPDGVLHIERKGHPPVDRLDRGCPQDWNDLDVGRWTDCHTLRPADQEPYWGKVRKIFEALVPDHVQAIDEYRQAFVEGY